jgi:hypothetical protein
MQRLFLLILSVCCFGVCHAQFKVISEGQIFDEPEEGYTKILQLKNGNTIFIDFTFKDGIYIKPFDSKHKEGAEVHVEPSYGNLSKKSYNAFIAGIFEVAGNVLVFVGKVEKGNSKLYRMIIDGNTGKLKEDKIIYELDVSTLAFYVKKDQYSENYAILMMNGEHSDKDRSIEAYHYDANNKVINHASYRSPENFFKYFEYVDMVVLGKDRICVMTYAYNTKKSGGKASEFLLANITAGDSSIKMTKLSGTQNVESVKGRLKYNQVTKKIIAVFCLKEDVKNGGYIPYVAFIDPAQNKIESTNVIAPTAATAKSAEIFGDKNAFYGLPQNIYVNNDGSFVVVHEEISVTAWSSSSGTTTYLTTLGNIAVSIFSVTGAQLGSYLIPKSHYLRGEELYPFYLADRDGQAQKMDFGNQYKSFSYIDGATKAYILFNDIADNEERVAKGKIPNKIDGVGECDAYAYNIEGREIMPGRKYVFGEPGRKEHNLAVFAVSDYDRASNVYVTLKLAKEGKHKGVQLVWLQPS